MILLQTTNNLNIQDFFTYGSFLTLAGATTIVYTVSGVVQNVFNFSPKWFALALAIVVSLVAAFGVSAPPVPEGQTPSQEISTSIKILIAVLNGFLIYASAAGINQMANGNNPPPGGAAAQRARPVINRTFRTNWWS